MQQGGKTSTQRLLLPPGAVERGSAVAAQAAHHTSCPLPLHGSGLPHLNSLRETLTEQHIYLLSCISHCQFAGLRLGLAPGLLCGVGGGSRTWRGQGFPRQPFHMLGGRMGLFTRRFCENGASGAEGPSHVNS